MITSANSIEPTPAEQAREALGLHVDDGSGYCEGCKSVHAFLVIYPCTVWQSANRTLIIERFVATATPVGVGVTRPDGRTPAGSTGRRLEGAAAPPLHHHDDH